MPRIKVECTECCNTSTVVTSCKEPIQYCPLCGVAVVLPEDEDDDDFEDDEDE